VGTETLCAIAELPAPAVPCQALAFSRDGSLLAGCSLSGDTVFVWDVKRREELRPLKGKTQLAALAFLDEKSLLTGGADGVIRLWDLDTYEESDRFEEPKHAGGVGTLVAAPDGERFVSAARQIPTPLLVWNRKNKKARTWLDGHTSQVYQLVFSPDGKRLASVGGDDATRLWDFDRRKEEAPALRGAEGGAFSYDGKRLLLHDIAKGVTLFELASPPSRLKEWTGVWKPLATLKDGKFLCTDGQSLQILDPYQETFARPYVGHRSAVRYIQFDPSGERLFSQGHDNQLLAWSLPSGRATLEVEHPYTLTEAARWSRDRSLVVLQHAGKSHLFANVTVRDIAQERDLQTFEADLRLMAGPAFLSEDNQEITMIGKDGLGRWSIASGERLGNSDELPPPGLNWPNWDGIKRWSWSADSSKFALWNQGLAALVYDIKQGKRLRQWQLNAGLVWLVVSDDGKRAFAGKDNGHIDVYDLSKERPSPTTTDFLHKAPVSQLYPSPDGKRLLSVDDRSHVVIWIWNTASWKLEVQWDHRPRVAHVAWAHDSRHLAIANGTLAIDILRLRRAK
jgi:WD40 repeat protein